MSKLEEFREYLLAMGKSPGTVQQYVTKVKQFLDFSKNKITKSNLIKFLAYIRKTRSMYTYSLVFYALQAYLKFIKREKLMKDIPQPKQPRPLPKYLTIEEVRTLIEHTGRPRDRALILLLFATGLRVSEIVSLKIGDVDFKRGIIRVYRHKSELESEIPVADFALLSLREAINTYIRKDENAPLFQNKYGEQLSIRSVQKILQNAAKRAGINKKVSPHILRHTYATFLLSKGFNLAEIQELLGHASIRTTRIYSHVVKSELERKYHKVFHSKTNDEKEPPIEIKVMFCPKCGYKIGQGWKYCINCGEDLSKLQ
jgi:integrase/recombinase XerD